MSPSGGGSSDDDEGSMHDVKPNLGSERGSAGRGQSLKGSNEGPPAGKKTKGRVKIKMEFIDNKLRRYTTFSKRKTGIMKKAYELSTLTGTGYEETELTYNVNEEEQQKVRQMMYSSHYSAHAAQHSTHNLFSPGGSSVAGYPSVSHSPYMTPHPPPSPSPSH